MFFIYYLFFQKNHYVISTFAIQFLEEPEVLYSKLKKIAKENPEVKNLRIIKKEGEDFKISFSLKEEEIGAILEDSILFLSWSENQSIASLFFTRK